MNAGYVLTTVVFQLPLLALLVAGLVLVGMRSARIGPRSTLFARLGLGLLLLDTLIGLGWAFLLPQLARSMTYSASRFGQFSALYGLVTTALLLAAVGLLIAAVVARPAVGGAGSFGPGSSGPGFGGPGFAAPGHPGFTSAYPTAGPPPAYPPASPPPPSGPPPTSV